MSEGLDFETSPSLERISPPFRQPRKGTAASCELKLIDCPSEDSNDRAELYTKMLIKTVRNTLIEATNPEYYARCC